MSTRWSGITLAVSLILSIPLSIRAAEGAQHDGGASPRLDLAVCDKAGLDSNTLQRIKSRLERIFANAGVELNWIHVEGTREPMTFLLSSWESCELPVVNAPFHAVITNEWPKGWPRQTMGFSAPRISAPYRLYVLYEGVTNVLQRVSGSDAATVAAYVMAHELGHLLLSKHHAPGGMMSPTWQYRQLVETAQGALRFDPADARRIRTRLEYLTPLTPPVALESSVLESAR